MDSTPRPSLTPRSFSPSLPVRLVSAITAYRVSIAEHARIDRHHAEVAPTLDRFPSRSSEAETLRVIEKNRDKAAGKTTCTSERLIRELDRLDLAGCIEGPDVFIVGDIEPENVRRLIVIATARLGIVA